MNAIKYLVSIDNVNLGEICLRKIALLDLEDVYEYASNRENTKYMMFPLATTIDMARDFIATSINSYSTGKGEIVFAIHDKKQGRLIGVCGVKPNKGNNYELGYILKKSHWGMNIMPRVVDKIVSLLFENTDANRVEAMCDIDNKASARVMEKCGMKYEGILREYILIRGRYRDTKIYSILKKEYEKRK